MIQFLVTGLNREKTQMSAEGIVARARHLMQSQKGLQGVSLIGPVEAPIARIRGRHRWQILFKGPSVRLLQQLTQQVLSDVKASGCEIKVDVDPVNFM
jgi:primosomal protein N' (replication factor Y)